MRRVHNSLAVVALALMAAFVFAACSSATPEQVSDAPASQVQQAVAPTSAPPAQAATPATTAAEPTPESTPTAEPSKPAAETAMSDSDLIVTPPTGDEKEVPEITGIASWINSEPLTFEEQRGKVLLVDFWTYTCVNCIRTLPFLKAWHEKYADHGLVIVGVHTPEFDFEKDRENVVDATEEFGLKWAIAQDNDFRTWRAFNNRYWPAKYLVDKDGLIRYTHFGEGAYDETELWIRGLLKEAGADVSGIPANTVPEPLYAADDLWQRDKENRLTREIYGGYERNYGALLRSVPYVLHREYYEEEGVEIFYTDPGNYRNDFLYLQGLWRNDHERLVHARQTEEYEDYLGLKFNATSVNAVMAPVNGNAYEVRVTLDDAAIPMESAGADVMFDDEGNGYVFVDQARMYNIVNLSEFSGHELKLSSNSDEFSLFAYTFGGYAGGEPAPTGPNDR